MCKISQEQSHVKVGYKVMALLDGRFYSVFTGQEITTGKVPLPPKNADPILRDWNGELYFKDFEDCMFYDESLVGKTSAFLTPNDPCIKNILYKVKEEWNLQ